MQDVWFYIFAALTLGCGFMVVANPFSRNPVTSAMFLVLTIVCLAGLFVLLHAFFLAAVQILIYAGAVMVLFLFVIMLLDLKEAERRRFHRFGLFAGALGAGSLTGMLLLAMTRSGAGEGLEPKLEGATAALGRELFTRYLLPFEIVSVLLLVAMIGVVLLSKKDVP
jgi:NADH-quinone oxidoreductase subunit J